MATLGTNVLTLLDWTKRIDPDGEIPMIAELLAQTNRILEDMAWLEGNLPTGHRSIIRTGLPTVYWRLLNQGVPVSKSTTKQVDEAVGLLEAWSEIDVDLAMLNGNTSEFRLSEAMAFIEAMNQEMAGTLFYGNSSVAPEEFNGLSVRYADLSAENAQNIINGGGAGADNTSIWLVVWGNNTVHGIFPKGSVAGLTREDKGKQTVETSNGVGGSRLDVLQEKFQWKAGVVVKDWRYAVRICNIDVSDLIADEAGSTVKLTQWMIKALHRIPNLSMGRPVFYMNRTVAQMLDIQALSKSSETRTPDNFDGDYVTTFRGVPIRQVDAILETEAVVS